MGLVYPNKRLNPYEREVLGRKVKQNTDILERIENEVSRQDEIIMRRIK